MTSNNERKTTLELGPSILVTCLVQTLDEADATFKARFLKRLERAYSEVREGPTTSTHTLEQLDWVREMLTGWSIISGQGKPFLDTYRPSE